MRKSKKTTLFILTASALLTAGCTSIQLSQEGQRVRSITPVVAQDCQFIGLLSSWKPALQGGIGAAEIDIRNLVAYHHGNAMVVVSMQVDPPPYRHGRISAEAYRCAGFD